MRLLWNTQARQLCIVVAMRASSTDTLFLCIRRVLPLACVVVQVVAEMFAIGLNLTTSLTWLNFIFQTVDGSLAVKEKYRTVAQHRYLLSLKLSHLWRRHRHTACTQCSMVIPEHLC